MERPVHLVPPPEQRQVDWPSIAAAPKELHRPRHLQAVPSEADDAHVDEEPPQAS